MRELKEKTAIIIHFGGLPEVTKMVIGKGDRSDAVKFWGDTADQIYKEYMAWFKEQIEKLQPLSPERLKAINDGMPSDAKYGEVFRVISEETVAECKREALRGCE